MTNNIETLNETAISTFSTLREEVRPYAKRFERFATDTGLDRFMKMELSENWTGDKYDVDITGPSVGGVTFTFHEEYFGDSYTYFFTIPYAYFEDPDTWEDDAKRRMDEITQAAADALHKVFPDFKTDPALQRLQVVVEAPFAYNADPLAVPDYFEYSFTAEYTSRRIADFFYKGMPYYARSFRYQLSTDSVFYRGYFDMKPEDEGAVITRPLTAEERAAEKAAVEARIEQRRQESIRLREERMETVRKLSEESRARKAQKRIEKQARHEENMRQKALAEAREAEQKNKE